MLGQLRKPLEMMPPRSPSSSTAFAATLLCVWLSGGVASARPADTATGTSAVDLFKEGEEAMARHDLERACDRFEQAWKLSREGGPLKRWAECEEARGRVVLARDLYTKLEEFAADAESRRVIAEAKERLEAQVGRIRVERVRGAPAELSVDLDGEVLAGDERILDPGKHRVRVNVPGQPPQVRDVVVRAGETTTVMVPLADAASPGAAPASEPAAAADSPSDGDASESGLSTLQVVGLVGVGVGVAAGVAATVTGLMVLDRQSTADDGCDANRQNCTPDALEAASSGDDLLVPNAIFFGVAAVGIVGGLSLVLFGGKASATTALTVSPARVSVRGTF